MKKEEFQVGILNTKKKDKQNAEWHQICSAMTSDSVRIRVPRAFLDILTHFFHHVSDAMGGDDRPDHGLAVMRKGREHYRIPFYFLYGKLKRAEEKMSESHRRKALGILYQYRELAQERENQFQEMIAKRHISKK